MLGIHNNQTTREPHTSHVYLMLMSTWHEHTSQDSGLKKPQEGCASEYDYLKFKMFSFQRPSSYSI